MLIDESHTCSVLFALYEQTASFSAQVMPLKTAVVWSAQDYISNNTAIPSLVLVRTELLLNLACPLWPNNKTAIILSAHCNLKDNSVADLHLAKTQIAN